MNCEAIEHRSENHFDADILFIIPMKTLNLTLGTEIFNGDTLKFSRGNGREYVVMALLVAVLIATFTDFLSPGRDSELSAIGSRSGLIVLGSNAMVRKETFINSAQ